MSGRTVRPAVKLLVERNGDILVLRAEVRDELYWILPGGGVEYGESPREALHREVREELTCDARIDEPVEMTHFYRGPDDNGDEVVITVFEGEVTSSEIDVGSNPADEYITGYHWLAPSEVIEKQGADHLTKVLQRYVEEC